PLAPARLRRRHAADRLVQLGIQSNQGRPLAVQSVLRGSEIPFGVHQGATKVRNPLAGGAQRREANRSLFPPVREEGRVVLEPAGLGLKNLERSVDPSTPFGRENRALHLSYDPRPGFFLSRKLGAQGRILRFLGRELLHALPGGEGRTFRRLEGTHRPLERPRGPAEDGPRCDPAFFDLFPSVQCPFVTLPRPSFLVPALSVGGDGSEGRSRRIELRGRLGAVSPVFGRADRLAATRAHSRTKELVDLGERTFRLGDGLQSRRFVSVCLRKSFLDFGEGIGRGSGRLLSGTLGERLLVRPPGLGLLGAVPFDGFAGLRDASVRRFHVRAPFRERSEPDRTTIKFGPEPGELLLDAGERASSGLKRVRVRARGGRFFSTPSSFLLPLRDDPTHFFE